MAGVEMDGSRRIDTDGIRDARDQLWAEALARYREGEKWWLEDLEIVQTAIEEQRGRYIEDVWQEKVIAYAKEVSEQCGDGTRAGTVSISEILGRMGMETQRQDQSAANRVARCLKVGGWKRTYVGPRGAREWRYRPVFQS
jgi:putative DNA primase/helicase